MSVNIYLRAYHLIVEYIFTLMYNYGILISLLVIIRNYIFESMQPHMVKVKLSIRKA